MKDGDVLTTRANALAKDVNKSLFMSVVFGTDQGTVRANGWEYDFRIDECICNDGENFTGDSMRWALNLVATGRVKKISMDEDGKVEVDVWAWVPSRQGRVEYHRGYWDWLYVYGSVTDGHHARRKMVATCRTMN